MKFKRWKYPTSVKERWIGLKFVPATRCYDDDKVGTALMHADVMRPSTWGSALGPVYLHRTFTIGLWWWEWQILLITKAGKPPLKKPVPGRTFSCLGTQSRRFW